MKFHLKTDIYFGEQSLENLKQLNVKHSMIVTDSFFYESHIVDKVDELLQEAGIETSIFCDVVPNPDFETITKGIEAMRNYKPDSIVAFGGGSSIDTAKAMLYVYNEKYGQEPLFVAIPTTSGTGSEVTNITVVSNPEDCSKHPISSKLMLPDIAILDPQFTMTVPATITADTGMDVFAHAIEAYVSTGASDFTDAFAEKAIRTVWMYLPEVVRNGDGKEAREKLQNASCMAGISFNTAALGICHSMAHTLGAHFNISHGKSCAVLLPFVIAYNASLDQPWESKTCIRYATIAEQLGIGGGTNKNKVHNLISQLKKFTKALGIDSSLKALMIESEELQQAIPEMAKQTLVDNCTITNPREPTQEDIESIFLAFSKGGYR